MKISFMGKQPYNHKNVNLNLLNIEHKKYANDLYYAQDVIGNYAKANNARVTFMEAADRTDIPEIQKSLTDFLNIIVEKKKENKVYNNFIKYDSKSDKPFLRRVYESLQQIIEGKELPIEQMKRDTYNRLVKAGKIIV